MGKYLELLYAGKSDWMSIAKKDTYRGLLEKVICQEKDVPNNIILKTMVELRRHFIAPREELYRVLARRGEPGWLAEHGRRAVTDMDNTCRMEAVRWLQYGRIEDRVVEKDLTALKAYLVDKNKDVRFLAFLALQQFLNDDPSLVVPYAIRWLKDLKPVDKIFASAAFVPAWGSEHSLDIFALQGDLLAKAKGRSQFAHALEQSIKNFSPDLKAAEAGWDNLLAPALDHLIAGDWKRAPIPQDEMLLYLMGTLLALHPVESMIQRAEHEISLLKKAGDSMLPPGIIAYGPWRAFNVYTTTVWKSYPDWWIKQLKDISSSGGNKIWAEDLKESRKSLKQLQESEPISGIPENKLDKFRRKALEFSHQKE